MIQIGWFHRYPARFSKDTLQEIFHEVDLRLNRLPNNILDPFAGTGSSLSYAKQLGIPSIGKELTHLGYLITQVRLNPPSNLEHALNLALDLVSCKTLGDPNKVNPELYFWIGEENSAKLDFLLSEVECIKDYKIRRWLKLALSSALRPSSRWLSGSIKPQVDPNRSFSDLSEHFLRVAKKLKTDCEIEMRNFRPNCPAKIILGNSQNLEFDDNSIDVVITSPPYGWMYDYFDVHRLSYLAFGWKRNFQSQIGCTKGIEKDGLGFNPPGYMKDWYQTEFKGESTYEGRALRLYFKSMKEHFIEVYRTLTRGGIIAYVIANSIRKGKEFKLVESLSDIMTEVGFSDIEITSKMPTSKRILPSGRNLKTGRFESNAKPSIFESVIYAMKPY